MMRLFTKDIDKKLFSQYKYGNDLSKQNVVAKIFNPYSRGTWYLLNSDENDPDYIWAIVDLIDISIGSVSRNELQSIKVPPYNLSLERDTSFESINAMELYEGLKEGKHYKKGGLTLYKSDLELKEDKNKKYWLFPTDNNNNPMGIMFAKGGRMKTISDDGVMYKDLSQEKPLIVNDSNVESKTFKVEEIDLIRKGKQSFVGSPTINGSNSAVEIFRQFWDEEALPISEHLNVMLLNRANKVIGLYQHSKGGITGTILDPEMVVLSAVKSLAKGVIVAHNHPSGNLQPSAADKLMSKNLKEALKLVDITLLDSLIITKDSYYSLFENGYLEKGGMMSNGGYMENGGGVGFESTEKLINTVKKYGSKSIGTESTSSDGTKYRYDRYIVKEGSVHNWLVDLFEKAAKENGDRYDTNFHYKDIYSIAYDRPKYKGVINGKIQISELIEHPKMSDGGYMAEGGVVDADVFDKLKKGDKIKITFGSSIQRNDEKELMVKSKTTVGKGKSWESEKITFVNLDNPKGVNYFAYKRGSGSVGFAIGDMAISNVKIKESYSNGGYMAKGGGIGFTLNSISKKEFGVDYNELSGSERQFVKDKVDKIQEINTISQREFALNYNQLSESKKQKVLGILDYDDDDDTVVDYMANGGMFVAPRKFKTYNSEEWTYDIVLNLLDKHYGLDEENTGKYIQRDDLLNVIYKYGEGSNQKNYEKVKNILIVNNWKILGVGDKMAKGGVTFADKVDAVKSSLLKRKKVAPAVQKDYGKTYSPKEAEESAKRIVGSQVAKYKRK